LSRHEYAALAQVVEHIIRNDGVAGSSPASGTIILLGNYNTLKFAPEAPFCCGFSEASR
jgi:hypothetical protein